MLGILAATASALAIVPAPAVAADRCAPWTTPATIAGRHVCLSESANCRARYQQRYRRYGFRCQGGSLTYDWTRLRRALHIPRFAPGSSCPATDPQGTLGQRGNVDVPAAPAFGPGPAYPTLEHSSGRAAALTLVWKPTDPPYLGWWGTKALWTVPRYTGAVLIRGGQLDGTNELGFDLGPNWTRRVHPEIRLIGPEYRLNPAATFVRSPGCYAYQVDTLHTSYLIVFEARMAPS